MLTDTQYLPMGGRSEKEKLGVCKYRQAIVNDRKGQQANAQGAPAELKKPPWAVLKVTTADLHCLKINLA